MKRKQFTFYYSFYDVISCIESPAVQAQAYTALCRYALLGEKPELEQLPTEVCMAVKAFIPVLDAARKKAQAGMLGGSKPKANASKPKANASKEQANLSKSKEKKENKDKEKKENEIEIEDECQAAFHLFWEAYPKKVRKQQAREEFSNVDVSVEVLLEALQRQKVSRQWLEEGGRFVPNPVSWLRQRRWEDRIEPGYGGKVPTGGWGICGESEEADLELMMQ